MQTRLSRICDAIIEAGWLTVLVVTPLFFNTLTNRVFEPDKIHLLRSVVLVMLVAWAIQLIDGGWRRAGEAQQGLLTTIRRTPLVLPALLLTAAYVLSTILSIVPRISLLGSYVRSQGLYTFLCYIALFFMVLTHLRTRAQVTRLSYAVVLTSLPIALHAILQHYGLDPLPWGGDVRERAAATLGNAIFLAAYLIMAFFVTLERVVSSAARLTSRKGAVGADIVRTGLYLFVLALQGIAILFTQSRGPWLGLAAGLYVFTLLGVWLGGLWAAENADAPGRLRAAARPVSLALAGLAAAMLLFLVVANAPRGPLAGLRERPYVGRIATMLDTGAGTNAVRVLIWEGVVDMMLKPHAPIAWPEGKSDPLNALRPLVGYGPESMWVAYNRFYPPDLAHYEARNASPDRAHNETFDSLVRTGIIGFATQLYLFGSIFYYALRWLGLMRTPGRRNLFLGLMAAGGLLGVLAPWLADSSLRLAGIGLPAGLMAGVMLYITLDVFMSSGKTASDLPQSVPMELRGRMVILALFAAIVAFFVEVHFGIAIAATLSHFWVFAALLVVLGMGWIREEVAPVVAPVAAARPQPATAPRGRKQRRAAAARQEVVVAPADRSPVTGTRSFLPFAALLAIVTLVLTWDFLVNQTGSEGPFAILWNAFSSRIDRTTFEVISSPGLWLVLILTWLAGGWLALIESAPLAPGGTSKILVSRRSPTGGGQKPGPMLVAYLAATLGVFVIYGLIQAWRVGAAGLEGLDVLRRVAAHVVFFDLCLLLLMVLLAVALRLADPAPRPAAWTQRQPVVVALAGLVLGALGLAIILRVNVRPIQADTYYKQGLAYEEAGSWEGAIVLYREAAGLQPSEDFYDLFLGRALLQLATMTQEGGSILLPEDVSNVPARELLSVVDQGIRSLSREDILRATNAILTAARRNNPLNTDHSANLGRLYRSWAFSSAISPDKAPDNQLLRDLVQQSPDQVHLPRLEQARRYYEEAVALSPHNVQLLNELATVHYILGDNAGALATLDRSAAVDPRYGQTYLLRGDALAAAGDRGAALDAYRQAAEIAPNDLNIVSAIGVLSAQLGQTDAAVDAFNRIVAGDAGSLSAAEGELASLDAQAATAGGYEKLTSAARDRRAALQTQIAALQSQLHLTHRNLALVLRDAGRTAEALQAAQEALTFADETQRPAIESLIADLRSARLRQDGSSP